MPDTRIDQTVDHVDDQVDQHDQKGDQEQTALHRQFRGTSGWFGYAEHYGVAQPITTLPPVYTDPGDPSVSLGNNGWALMSYAVSVPGLGQSGCDWCPGHLRRANLTGGFLDGTGNTLLVAERYARPGECFNAAWGSGNNAWDPIFSQWGVQSGFESRPSPAQASCYVPHAIHSGGLFGRHWRSRKQRHESVVQRDHRHGRCPISASACSSQNRMPISRHIVAAVARWSWASSGLPPRRASLPKPR